MSPLIYPPPATGCIKIDTCRNGEPLCTGMEMAMTENSVTVLVGTTKGAFLISGGSERQGWTVRGPFCGGWPINHVVGDPATGRLWAGGGGEFHGAGVWRSEDAGATWQLARLTKGQIARGLSSTFGFPICVHPREPETIWTMPLNGDTAGRFPPDAAAAVWRSRDGGETWQAMRDGLPQQACYFTVLRQAMARDERDPVGIYFGTNSGSVFASADEGESWREIARHLPTVLSIETFSSQGS